MTSLSFLLSDAAIERSAQLLSSILGEGNADVGHEELVSGETEESHQILHSSPASTKPRSLVVGEELNRSPKKEVAGSVWEVGALEKRFREGIKSGKKRKVSQRGGESEMASGQFLFVLQLLLILTQRSFARRKIEREKVRGMRDEVTRC